MVARDFDQYLFFYEFLNAFTGIIGKKIDRERVKQFQIHCLEAPSSITYNHKNNHKPCNEPANQAKVTVVASLQQLITNGRILRSLWSYVSPSLSLMIAVVDRLVETVGYRYAAIKSFQHVFLPNCPWKQWLRFRWQCNTSY